ncbi:MAG: hypothetical protein KAW91_01730 [candidate division Zixibacteria bacterium]|nr:hypothetical protein [candidate division Zixibacteria bacterium]
MAFIDDNVSMFSPATYRLFLLCLLVQLPAGRGAAAIDGLPVTEIRVSEAAHEGLFVDSIVIDNRNIYDTENAKYGNFVFKTANALHWTTRKRVVRREVLLRVGEPYSQELAEETARNLRRCLTLYDAWVETSLLPNGHLLVRVVTIDQWSISGGFNVNREGNEVRYQIGVADKNLLGNNQFFDIAYFFREIEDDHLTTHLADNRVFGWPLSLGVDYSNDPLASFQRLAVGRPFYDLSQRFSYSLSAMAVGGRRDIYDDEAKIAQSRYAGDLAGLALAYSTGPHADKIRLKLGYDYRFERSYDKDTLSNDPQDWAAALAGFPRDSLYHRVSAMVGYSRMSFVSLRQIDGFGYTEDFTLGPSVAVKVARAVNSDEVVFDNLGLGLAHTCRFRAGLVRLSCESLIWVTHGTEVRRLTDEGLIRVTRGTVVRRSLTEVALQAYNRPSDVFTVAARANYRMDRMGNADNLALGGTNGLRGFETYFRNGNRRAVLNVEGRTFPGLELLSVMIGATLFADIGRTWKSGEPFRFRDFDASVGAGLRVSFEKSSKTALFRLDVAYSERNGWQLSIGSGQYFRAATSVLPLTSH